MPDIILLNELSDMISELNSSFGLGIDTINLNVNEVKATVNAINTATAVNNTASTTGTLSQKLSSIISTLSTVSSDVTTLKNKSFCKISGGTTTTGTYVTGKCCPLAISGYWIASGEYGTKVYIGNGTECLDSSDSGTYNYISFSNN